MVKISIILLFFLGVECFRLYLLLKKQIIKEMLLQKGENEIFYLSHLISTGLQSNLAIGIAFPDYLNYLKKLLNWSYHSIFRLDESKQVLVIRFTGFLPDWYMDELSSKVLIKVGDAAVGRAIATKQPTTINTANNDPRFKSVTPLAGQTGYRSLSCYPLIGSLKTYGGFCTYSQLENSFSLRDTEFFMVVANYFAGLLEVKLLANYLKTKGVFFQQPP